jgi:blue copper oxidase
MPTIDLPKLVSRRTLLLAGGASLIMTACGKATKSEAVVANSPTSTPSVTTHVHPASSTTVTSAGATTPSAAPTASAAEVTPNPTAATPGYNALWIPPALKGPNFDLSLASSSKQLQPGAKSATYGYNGSEFWGPTLFMTKGDQVKINLTNKLTEDTTTHWHGFHIPAEMDGGPHQVVAVGATWSPSFEVKNKAATYWYHPHMHETTQKQMNLGAGGFIIVQDAQEAALPLPRTYGVDDIPLMLTSRSFGTGNTIDTKTIYGDVLFTNGTLKAEASLPAQVVRFRILNAEIERAYNLGFTDGRTFHVIATDGGLVNAPVPVTRLLMSPGERYEILVDLSKDAAGSAVTMQSFNSGFALGFPGGEPASSGTFGSLLNNKTFDVLRIVVTAQTASGETAVPTTLTTNTYWAAKDATNTRSIAITDHGPGSPFTFNNAGYDMSTVNETVKLDTVEQWKITNGRTFGHSFHIHDVQFAIVSRSTGPIPDHEKGWKDTFYIQVNETVSFVAKFDDFVSKDHPFMYHCHMSNHEDEGLMGQFVVTA